MAEIARKTWTELAQAAQVEQDSEKLLQIVEELNRVLEEENTVPVKDPKRNYRSATVPCLSSFSDVL